MGIVRLLTILFIIWFIWSLYRRFIQQQTGKPAVKTSAREKVPTVKQCAFCGIHIPLEEAIQRNGRYYCSQGHYEKDVK